MIIAQKSKDKYLKDISSLIAKSPASNCTDLSDLSCFTKRELKQILTVLEALINDGLISVYVKSGLHKIISAPDNPELQIMFLRSSLTPSADLPDVLQLKNNTTVTISINEPKSK